MEAMPTSMTLPADRAYEVANSIWRHAADYLRSRADYSPRAAVHAELYAWLDGALEYATGMPSTSGHARSASPRVRQSHEAGVRGRVPEYVELLARANRARRCAIVDAIADAIAEEAA